MSWRPRSRRSSAPPRRSCSPAATPPTWPRWAISSGPRTSSCTTSGIRRQHQVRGRILAWCACPAPAHLVGLPRLAGGTLRPDPRRRCRARRRAARLSRHRGAPTARTATPRWPATSPPPSSSTDWPATTSCSATAWARSSPTSVACGCATSARTEPLHLFVSGSRAPHLYGDRSDHTLPDAELHRLVSDLGGLGAGHEVGVAYLARRLPVLRADLHACDTYRWRPRRPLGCPMTAFSAADDPIASFGQVEAWRAYTTSSFLHRHLTGGHFFLNGGAPRSRLLRELRRELGRVRGATDTAAPASPSPRNRSWTC
ncbi:thioesterase II family protein [Streptomyces aurantiogriseus]